MTYILHNTIDKIKKAIVKAESDVKTLSRDTIGGFDEEQITTFLRAYVESELKKISKNNTIANAFSNDMQNYLLLHPELDCKYNDIVAVSTGLIAEVSWHTRHVEGKQKIEGEEDTGTGGDFGLTISQPKIEINNKKIDIVSEGYRNGLLVQAKLQLLSEKFGKLTTKQKRVLKGRLGYSSLLLYTTQNDNLNNFKWILCKGFKMQDIKGWLKKGVFPINNSTAEIIDMLGRGSIGTDDESTINNIILAEPDNAYCISIHWKDDGYKGSLEKLNKNMQKSTEPHVKNYR